MSEESSDPDLTDASPSSTFDEADSPEWEAGVDDLSSEGTSASFALDVARLWVQEHQKASMLGAFAVGVFIGALFRD